MEILALRAQQELTRRRIALQAQAAPLVNVVEGITLVRAQVAA